MHRTVQVDLLKMRRTDWTITKVGQVEKVADGRGGSGREGEARRDERGGDGGVHSE